MGRSHYFIMSSQQGAKCPLEEGSARRFICLRGALTSTSANFGVGAQPAQTLSFRPGARHDREWRKRHLLSGRMQFSPQPITSSVLGKSCYDEPLRRISGCFARKCAQASFDEAIISSSSPRNMLIQFCFFRSIAVRSAATDAASALRSTIVLF